jgi:hypothetical protein
LRFADEEMIDNKAIMHCAIDDGAAQGTEMFFSRKPVGFSTY